MGNGMEAMNTGRSFVVFLLVFSSVVSSSSLDSITVNNRSVKKDSSNSEIKSTTSTPEATTSTGQNSSTPANDRKNDTNADIELAPEQAVLSRVTTESPKVEIPPNMSTPAPAPVHQPRKPFEGSVTILFVGIFVVGFVGVVVFYIWKRSTDSAWRAPATYQYSVLNSFDNDPEDELTDHLRVGDDFIVTNDSSDDDVELLGQNSLINPRMDTGSLLLSFGSGQHPTPLIGTVAHPAQVNGIHPNQFPTGRISSAILDDSDEELLQ